MRPRTAALATAALLAAAALAALLWPRPVRALKIATWNLEWLVAPDTARRARIACREQRRAPLPCDVVRRLARDSADLARLAQAARRLDADVVAFQEVEDARTARRVFRGYRICIASGTGVQHVGFAVRRGLAHRCGPPLDSLAAGGRGRPGLLLHLQAPGLPAMQLLAVHLKSGCSSAPLEGAAACRLLGAQARALGAWITDQGARGAPFIVLGDFNRTGTPASGDPFWQLLGPGRFQAAASSLPFANCVFGQPYAAYIDHILVGEALAGRIGPSAFARTLPPAADAARYRLSDHCPVSVMLDRAGASESRGQYVAPWVGAAGAGG